MKTADFLKHEISRRQFLGSSAYGAAGMAAGVVSLGAATAKAAAGERVTVGVIGLRNQGKTLAAGLAALGDTEIIALCDVDQRMASVADAVESIQGRRPRFETEFRRILDDSPVDAVVIATPDHWHAVMTLLACQAGKDVYLEVPTSHTIAEGQLMLAAAQKHGRIVQTGLQQRSGSHFRSAVDLVRSGRLGEIKLARAWTVHKRKGIGFKADSPVPEGVDYDLWLGPAAARPFNANRFHHNWHWYWDYGSGELGRWGVHLLDVARWGLGVDLPSRVSSAGGKFHFHDDQETPDTQIVTYTFPPASRPAERRGNERGSSPDITGDGAANPLPAKTIIWEHRHWHTHAPEGRSAAVAFYGEHGTLIVDRGGWKVYDCRDSLTSDTSDQAAPHYRNFIDSIRTRRPPIAGLESGHVSTTLAHLGNIAQRLGREIQFDPAAGNFGFDTEANALLSRAYRAPWELPRVS